MIDEMVLNINYYQIIKVSLIHWFWIHSRLISNADLLFIEMKTKQLK